MTAPHPVASRSPDRTGVCCAGRGTPSAYEMTTRRVFYQKISPIKGHIVIYRAGLGRTRAGTHLVLPSSATGRSHLGNLGSRQLGSKDPSHVGGPRDPRRRKQGCRGIGPTHGAQRSHRRPTTKRLSCVQCCWLSHLAYRAFCWSEQQLGQQRPNSPCSAPRPDNSSRP